jgi:hypothetical protein
MIVLWAKEDASQRVRTIQQKKKHKYRVQPARGGGMGRQGL